MKNLEDDLTTHTYTPTHMHQVFIVERLIESFLSCQFFKPIKTQQSKCYITLRKIYKDKNKYKREIIDDLS